jgi:dsRNA-specific ribonuclease
MSHPPSFRPSVLPSFLVKKQDDLCTTYIQKIDSDVLVNADGYAPLKRVLEAQAPASASEPELSSFVSDGERGASYYAYKMVFRRQNTGVEVEPHLVSPVLLLLRRPLTEAGRDAHGGGTTAATGALQNWILPMTYIPKESGWRVVSDIAEGIDVDFEPCGTRTFSNAEAVKANEIHAIFLLAARFRFPSEQLQDYIAARRKQSTAQSSNFFTLPCDAAGSIQWDIFEDRWTTRPSQKGAPDLIRPQLVAPGVLPEKVAYGLEMYSFSIPKNVVISDVIYCGAGNQLVRKVTENEEGVTLTNIVEWVSDNGSECPFTEDQLKKLKAIPILEEINFETEPVVLVRSAPRVINVVYGTYSKISESELDVDHVWPTFPRFLTRSPVPMHCFRASSVLPTIVDTVEHRLRAMEFMSTLDLHLPVFRHVAVGDLGPLTALVDDPVARFQQALTTPSGINSSSCKIHHSVTPEKMLGSEFKRNRHPDPTARVTLNYEVLETLGDAVLKLAVTQILFSSFPISNEGQLSPLKAFLVSNVVLFERAVTLKITDWVRCTSFCPRSWHPQDHPDDPSRQNRRVLSNKTVADVVEALLGAVYISYGFKYAVKFLDNFLQLFDALKTAERALKTVLLYPHKGVEKAPRHYAFRVQEMERSIGHTFRNQILACESLTHVSYLGFTFCDDPRNRIGCYQRFEFLGDAVVDLIVVRVLYDNAIATGKGSPLYMALSKSQTVTNNMLGAFSIQLGVPRYLFHFSPQIFHCLKSIMAENYEEQQQRRRQQQRQHRIDAGTSIQIATVEREDRDEREKKRVVCGYCKFGGHTEEECRHKMRDTEAGHEHNRDKGTQPQYHAKTMSNKMRQPYSEDATNSGCGDRSNVLHATPPQELALDKDAPAAKKRKRKSPEVPLSLPKICGDLYEAVCGAIYIDVGCSVDDMINSHFIKDYVLKCPNLLRENLDHAFENPDLVDRDDDTLVVGPDGDLIVSPGVDLEPDASTGVED